MRRFLIFLAAVCSMIMTPALAQTAVYQTAPPTLTAGQRTDLTVDSTGALRTASTVSDANGTVVQSALSANTWSLPAGASGIVNTTTAVTIKAASGAGVRNYLLSAQCNSDALGAATELVVRDGASGTVMWRQKIATSGWLTPIDFTFNPPLKGTANTLTEVATLTASVTGGVYCNFQGYTGP